MYTSKKKALSAYAAYLAISHTEAFAKYLQFVVAKARELCDATTTADVARRIATQIKVVKNKEKEFPLPGSKIRSKGKEPIERMK